MPTPKLQLGCLGKASIGNIVKKSGKPEDFRVNVISGLTRLMMALPLVYQR
ncbi:uncharacterized protein Dvar_46940 [Desulfosarcina variabilis str. Montpellier]